MSKLSRRSLLASTIGVVAGTSLRPALGQTRTGRKPNIVFILADDLGYGDLSCYGRPDYKTPAIDRLAAEGLRFTQGYANSAVCSATRTALITGRYQDRLAIGLEEPLTADKVGLPPEHPTLPSLLRKVGYTTTLIGKWHLGFLPDYGPLKSGYDHFWGFRGGALDYFTHALGKPDLWSDDHPIEQAGYMTDLLGDRAVKVIEENAAAKTPFFISLHFNAPHWPWEGPEDEAESKRLAMSKQPAALFDYDGGSQKTYAAMVKRMDDQVGRILQALDRLELADETIVVFTSDNGGERYSDTYPFTGKKTELLEGGLRIPAIVRWPGHIPPQAVSDQVMISMDWLPTLVDIAGTAADPAYPTDGMDLTATLTQAAPAKPRQLFWRYLNLSQQACRDGDMKYLKVLNNTFLFDVAADPLERANLKGRQPDAFDRLTAAYAAWDKTMLPLDPKVNTGGFTGQQLADHFGVTNEKMFAPVSPD